MTSLKDLFGRKFRALTTGTVAAAVVVLLKPEATAAANYIFCGCLVYAALTALEDFARNLRGKE